jgi:hypothetical protein
VARTLPELQKIIMHIKTRSIARGLDNLYGRSKPPPQGQMMQFFSTDFPLATGTTGLNILEECLHWVAQSPHTSFSESDLLQNIYIHDFVRDSDQESIRFEFTEDGEIKIHSFTYTKNDPKIVWVTSISFLNIPATGEAWVNVKSYCNSRIATVNLPDIKKPLIVIRLIDRYGGGYDGLLKVNHEALQIPDNDEGLGLAASLINNEAGNRLPIVYVSRYHTGFTSVITERLGRKLCGLAHLVVEPNRNFSNKLRRFVNGQNVYGGAVAVYWPSDGGVSIYRKSSDEPVGGFEDSIFSELSELISQRMPLRKCSTEALREAKNKQLIERLKSEDSADISAYIEAFDQELRAKDDEIHSLKREVIRLEGVSRSIRARNPVQGGIHIDTGGEEDFFDNELLWIILDAIQQQREMVTNDSRRFHILESILNQPLPDKLSENLAAKVKELLRSYREMTPKIRTGLIDLGFSISDQGKHIKLIYQSDERYTFTLPKSGSDNRGGLNAALDLSRLFF